MASESNVSNMEAITGLRRSDLIVPKLPMVDPETKKRQDGRTNADIRPIFVQTGVRTGSRGSAYLEMGNTKVICVVEGPKDLPRRIDFSETGRISIEIQSISGKVPDKDKVLIKDALEAVVILEKFPKAVIEVSLTILEDCGSITAACVTTSGLALMDADIPMYDLPIGVTLLFQNRNIYLDPTRLEVQALDLTDNTKNEQGGGTLTMGYLPSREQICLFTMEGKMDPEFLSQCMDTLTAMTSKVFAVIRHHTVQKMKSKLSK